MTAEARTAPGRAELLEVVWWACRAPSVHNTQPWHWTVDEVLELRSDPGRRLRETDPDGRDVVLSGGASLDHAVCAAHALGWRTSVERFPDPSRPDLLARIEVAPGHEDTPRSDLALITRRSTDRRRYGPWRVPDVRVDALARVAERRGTRARAMTDPRDHALVERLVADSVLRQPAAVSAEAARWVDRGPSEGIPSASVPAGPRDRHPANRFAAGLLEDEADGGDAVDSWIVLGDVRDDPATWLRAGEGLSAVWLEAVRGGLAAQPVTHVVESPEARDRLRDVLGWVPHILLRLGWADGPEGRPARSTRRPLGEITRL